MLNNFAGLGVLLLPNIFNYYQNSKAIKGINRYLRITPDPS